MAERRDRLLHLPGADLVQRGLDDLRGGGDSAEALPATAHSRYDALIRRLVSFERAAECAGSST